MIALGVKHWVEAAQDAYAYARVLLLIGDQGNERKMNRKMSFYLLVQLKWRIRVAQR